MIRFSFHPNGQSELTYCTRCQPIPHGLTDGSGLVLCPVLCRECAPIVKREVFAKIDADIRHFGALLRIADSGIEPPFAG